MRLSRVNFNDFKVMVQAGSREGLWLGFGIGQIEQGALEDFGPGKLFGGQRGFEHFSADIGQALGKPIGVRDGGELVAQVFLGLEYVSRGFGHKFSM